MAKPKTVRTVLAVDHQGKTITFSEEVPDPTLDLTAQCSVCGLVTTAAQCPVDGFTLRSNTP